MRSYSSLLFGAALLRVAAASKWVDCAAGTSYYVCQSNGFRGCCSIDACNAAWCPDAGSPAPPPGTGQTQAPPPNTLVTVTGAPPATSTAACTTKYTRTGTTGPRPTDCPAGTKGRVWFPDSYDIFHDHPNYESNRNPVGIVMLHQESFDGKTVVNKRDALIRFPVPKGAKTCMVGLQMTNIQVNMGYNGGSAYNVEYIKLQGSFEETFHGKPSYNKVQPLRVAEGKKDWQGDMTSWPEVQADGKTYLTLRPLPCAEDVTVLMSLLAESSGATLIFGQNNGTSGRMSPDHGFYLDYTC
ncbi:hypothetical protein P154DRAFT_524146 [Amniculicola lignicola CBS 123094]|uniref:Lytic polysaccharide monooxygenase n=1 Tax=Amniculicola lignicola CBS 123094 TaxID=1392246 RepID=A0A6A5WE85_9PLEO|nr:hypothetical protein P154DRAFT_524146 [Amniculicola lignicola CBS 123094]